MEINFKTKVTPSFLEKNFRSRGATQMYFRNTISYYGIYIIKSRNLTSFNRDTLKNLLESNDVRENNNIF